jgi:hypothetical protein
MTMPPVYDPMARAGLVAVGLPSGTDWRINGRNLAERKCAHGGMVLSLF